MVVVVLCLGKIGWSVGRPGGPGRAVFGMCIPAPTYLRGQGGHEGAGGAEDGADREERGQGAHAWVVCEFVLDWE